MEKADLLPEGGKAWRTYHFCVTEYTMFVELLRRREWTNFASEKVKCFEKLLYNAKLLLFHQTYDGSNVPPGILHARHAAATAQGLNETASCTAGGLRESENEVAERLLKGNGSVAFYA